jgi:GT2 family glycosyltransferase
MPSFSQQPPGLAVVTVTYGRRSSLLAQLLASVQSQVECPIDVIVVFNGPGHRLPLGWQSKFFFLKIAVINNAENLGSAAGYSQGISAACRIGASHILLIDDDNIVLDGALPRLLGFLMREKKAVIPCLNRVTRPKYADILSGKSGSVVEKSNKCIGVGLGLASLTVIKNTDVQCLPFSGLVIPVTAVDKIGLPDQAFFVYQDDRDFTYRLWLAGYTFCILQDAKIADLEGSWDRKNSPPIYRLLPSIMHPESSDFKVFHSVRSRVIFNLKHQVTNLAIYKFNMVLFLIVCRVLATILPRRMASARFTLIREATRDGLKRGSMVSLSRPPVRDNN